MFGQADAGCPCPDDRIATDPSAVDDFAAYCESSGHTLVDWNEKGGVYKFRLRK